MTPLSDRVAGWSPIFEKQQNRFVFLNVSMVCASSLDAKQKGRESVEVLGPMLGIVFTGEVHMIPETKVRYAPASLQLDLACVSGPVWSQTFRNTIIQAG